MDNWKIQMNQETLGEIPYHSLPVYRLFCEHIGFELKRDQQSGTLHLTSRLPKNKILFMPMRDSDSHISILKKIKEFLAEANIDATILPANSTIHTDGKIAVKLDVDVSDGELSSCTVMPNRGAKIKRWVEWLKQECKKHGFSFYYKEGIKTAPIPTFEIKIKYPSAKALESEENISMMLATTVLRIVSKNNPLLFTPAISFDSIGIPLSKISSTISEKPKLENQSRTAESSETAVTPVKKPTLTQTPNATPLPPFRLEVCFDYQLIIPANDDDDYIVLANIVLKNTGLGAIPNPHICLEIPTKSGIKVKGQMVPPNVTDTVGVQSFSNESPVGWQYADEDWQQKAKDLGEYVICPIQSMNILPGKTTTFSNLQIFIPSSYKGDMEISGFIKSKELNLTFPASNGISLSFS